MGIAANLITPVANVPPLQYTQPVATPGQVSTFENIVALQDEMDLINMDQTVSGTGATTTGSTASSAAANTASLDALVDLSPQALAVLNGVNSVPTTSANTAAVQTSDTTLSTDELQSLANITAEFDTAPLTTATFTELQTALTDAGINPEQVSLQDMMFAMNYMTLSPFYDMYGQAAANYSLAGDLTNA